MQKQELKGVPIQNNAEVQALFGQGDAFLKIIEDDFNVRVVLKSDRIAVLGENQKEVDRVVAVLESLLHRIRKGEQIQTTDVNYVIRVSAANEPHVLDNSPAESIPVFSKRGVIRPKTAGQSRYVEGIKTTTSYLALDRRGQGKPTLLWRWLFLRLKVGR